MAQYSLFVLEVMLNPNQPTNQPTRADPNQDHSRALYASTTGLPKHWRKRPGRPRQTWLRTIENDLRPLNLGLVTAQRRVQNRTAWQTLVETAPDDNDEPTNQSFGIWQRVPSVVMVNKR